MIHTLFPSSPIGHMMYRGDEYIFYWVESTDQVLIRKRSQGDVSWILQSDCTTALSLAALMDCDPDSILIQDWEVVSAHELSNNAPRHRGQFLESHWSDYAIYNMTPCFVCRVMPDSQFSASDTSE
jgi:hypothetical protein